MTANIWRPRFIYVRPKEGDNVTTNSSISVPEIAYVAVRADEPTRRADTEIDTSTPEPPPLTSGKNLEVPGLLMITTSPPETESVEHSNVKDPGKTHEQGGELPKVGSQNITALENETLINSNSTEVENVTNTNSTEEIFKTSVIYTCNFPKSWLKQARNKSSSFNGWMDNGENDTNVCSFPPDWLNSTDTLHICTINKEWLKINNYTIQNGTIPKELLAETNTSNIRCVTPKDALEGDADDFDNSNDTSHFSTILPRAWLREGNDIYIYLVPYENVTEIEAEEHTTVSQESSPVTSTSTEDVPTLSPSSGTETVTVNITSDATTVKVFANKTAEESTTSLPASTTNQTTLEASTESMSPAPKINTSAEDSAKNSTKSDDSDKNKTVREKEEMTEPPPTTKQPGSTSSTTADDAENIINHSDSTTPSSPSALLQTHADHDHLSSSGKTAFLQPTESAAILAGVFVGIAILGYVGLLVWRRLLERRYGHREMLVNEDDDFDTSDMRHFESGLEDCEL
ncbi:mucin-22 isoform X2 [Anabrus simplex]|uniref:mucin-22 isoform X2 n=1 Tax=Anabrus simplex TaxID=316456 RepID=UPI0035A35237